MSNPRLLIRGAALGIVASVTTDSWPYALAVLAALVAAFMITDEEARR